MSHNFSLCRPSVVRRPIHIRWGLPSSHACLRAWSNGALHRRPRFQIAARDSTLARLTVCLRGPRHDKVPRCCCCCRVRRRLRHATQDHAPGIMTPGACTRTTVDSCCMVSSASRHHSALRNSSPCTSCVVRRGKMRRWPGGGPQASHRPGLLAAASPSRGRGRGE